MAVAALAQWQIFVGYAGVLQLLIEVLLQFLAATGRATGSLPRTRWR